MFFLLQLENVTHMCNDKWGLYTVVGHGIEAILLQALRLNYVSSLMFLFVKVNFMISLYS